ncbi:MAG: HAMP domain-containing methyl-accepting chemotaxis protein [Betaproteobacteria bacterium]
MNNLKIGTRLWIGFSAVALLILCVTGFAYIELRNIKTQTDSLANINFTKAQLSSDAQESMQKAFIGTMTAVYADDPAVQKREKDNVEKQRSLYREAFKKLEELESNDEGKVILGKIKNLTLTAAAANNKALAMIAEGRLDEARRVIKTESNSAMNPLLESFDELSAYLKSRTNQRYSLAVSAYDSGVTGLIIGGIIAVLIAIACSIFIARSVVVPLQSMIVIMRNIAEGERDLTQNMNLDSQDELGELAKWFDMFMDNIQEDINNIGKSTHKIAAAAVQLHATAEQIATGAEEVESQVNNIAAAGEEMSATSADISENCNMAAEGSRQATAAAVSGTQVVEETIAMMNSIAKRVKETAVTVETLGNRSEQIGEIVGTIQDIADQTNLLALNAAIEAARAGEQGRGFAVVADEVRKLAERTRKATTEISEMIKTIQSETHGAVIAMELGVDEVAKGSEKAAQSGKALESILGKINEVTHQVNEVATAATEQTSTNLEISKNMYQITEVITQTSHGAHDTTKAADQLSELAGELDRIVGQFKV